MNYGHLIRKSLDETGNNRLQIPFGHAWRIMYGHLFYVASSDVATRTIVIRYDFEGIEDTEFFQETLTASQTRRYGLGWLASTITSLNEHQHFPTHGGQGMWLPALSSIFVDITNEQAADDWDLEIMIEDIVVPRA